MTTLKHAAEYVASKANERGLKIEQCDPVLCETGDAVMFYAYDESDECFTASIDLPAKLTDNAFLLDEWRSAFMKLIPDKARAATAWP
ncbi:hypothetical protein ACFOOP_10260 [Marinicaulis aureus]|uniref:Uncharacterized protein n=1 Tax=Hyphococcus aureus TaxID=2666033 RepID=A0ABW1L2F1_9PROT